MNDCITGSVPTSLKVATVTPLLKMPSLDTSVLNNYLPISVVPFISKVLEKVVLCQFKSFLNKKVKPFQFHSTESALLGVLNDIFVATDVGDCDFSSLRLICSLRYYRSHIAPL